MQKPIWILIIVLAVAAAGVFIWQLTAMNSAAPIYTQDVPASSTTSNPTDASSTPDGVTVTITTTTTTVTTTRPVADPGKRCGGNMQNSPICSAGYHCAPEPGSHLPFGDVGGTCVAN